MRDHFVRFQATTPNRRGIHPGVFALVNGLARDGRLTAPEEQFRRTSNAWFEERVTNPIEVRPDIFTAHPLAVSWFRDSAHDLLERIPGYLAILDAHSVAWERVDDVDPGAIVYADADQVLATTEGAGGGSIEVHPQR